MSVLELNTEQIKLITKTFQKAAATSEESTSIFYNRLFEIAPEMKPIFIDIDIKRLSDKLFKILKITIGSISQPHLLAPALHQLGTRHRGYGAEPKMYVPMGEALLWMLAHQNGDVWSDEAQFAWKVTYDFMAHTAIEALENKI